MADPVLRPALPADLPAVERIVRDAYAKYIERIGKPPEPMWRQSLELRPR